MRDVDGNGLGGPKRHADGANGSGDEAGGVRKKRSEKRAFLWAGKSRKSLYLRIHVSLTGRKFLSSFRSSAR